MTKSATGKHPGGRPLKVINWTEFDKLCEIQCPLSEIASWFDCTEDTIETAVKREKGLSFSDYYTQKRGKGKIALRRRQFQKAVVDGDNTMLIWLGKSYLEQSDTLRINETSDAIPVSITILEIDGRTGEHQSD